MSRCIDLLDGNEAAKKGVFEIFVIDKFLRKWYNYLYREKEMIKCTMK